MRGTTGEEPGIHSVSRVSSDDRDLTAFYFGDQTGTLKKQRFRSGFQASGRASALPVRFG